MQGQRPVTTVRYAEPDYWEARYQREPALFEWFFGHTALRRIIRTYISKKKSVLHIGCGTSNLQEGMARSGYHIVNTDISEVVIRQMQERHKQYTNMTYRVSDCRCMPEFLDCSFGHVLDKGTMDALLCCKQGTDNVMRMLMEIYRVLQPGGLFLLITLGDPSRRLPLLCDARLPWKVSLLLLPNISAANQAYVDGKPINDSTQPVEAQGPFEVVDADTILDLPPGVQFSNFFFAYACKKQPLQLPQHHGQKGQLPNGWVAGSKELFQKLQKELGLPEDLLDKGRRKRVMTVPAGSGMHGLPYMHNSSNASLNSGNSSPVLLAGAHGGNSSSSIPAAPLCELQSALTALQLQQLQSQPQLQLQSQRQTSTSRHQLDSSTGSDGQLLQRDVPARPQSAPDLVAMTVAETAAATAAAAGAGGVVVGQDAASPGVGGTAASTAPCSPRPPVASPVSGVDPQQVSYGSLAAAVEASPAALGSIQPALVAAPVEPAGAAAAPEQQQGYGCGTCNSEGTASSSPVLFHPLSSPAQLVASAGVLGGQQQQQQLTAGVPLPQLQPRLSTAQVFNFAAPPTATAADPLSPFNTEGAPGPALESAAVESSPLPPAGRPQAAVASTPTSPASSPSHLVNSSQPAAWPGIQLQQGQVLPQLQGQQALALSAATAAGMYPHPVAPRGTRAPRLRRFSTEYGALSGSALQMQLEQLRLLQAQHSESAADGLVLHDVAAGDVCDSSAAAAAVVAAAAWGSVRRPRDRRLSNISILSGLSIMSSTSIDESGEDLVCDGLGSAAHTCVSSSEPSCQMNSLAQVADAREASVEGTPNGLQLVSTPGPAGESST